MSGTGSATAKQRRSRSMWGGFAGMALFWLVSLLLTFRAIPFESGPWQRFHQLHFTGGQGGSLAPRGDMTRARMAQDLLNSYLHPGLPRSAARRLLGTAETSGGNGAEEEEMYELVDRPGILNEFRLLRRWGNTDPALYVTYLNGKLVTAYIR